MGKRIAIFVSIIQILNAFHVQNNILAKREAISSYFSPTVLYGKTSNEIDESNGYGPVGSLLRQGPVPFLIRVINPSTYDAAVEKYMKIEKCSKLEAQANMDAYFMDPK